MIHDEMMGILGAKDPCDNPLSMMFDPANPTELTPGQEATLNIIGGVAPFNFEIIQSSLFYFDDSYISWAYQEHEDSIKVTSYFSVDYIGINAAQSTHIRHNGASGNAWYSANGQPTEQRFNIDFGEAKVISQIMIENSHASGGALTAGIKNFDIQGSNNANAHDQVDYSSDQYWTDIQTGLQAAMHAAANFDDPQIFDIDNEIAYRYISLKIADNWGYGSYMGLRHVQFHTGQKKVYAYETNDRHILVKAPQYALWTPRIKCTDFCDQVDEAWLYSSPGKWQSKYSSGSGGTPTICGEEYFRSIKNGVMFVGGPCNTNNLGPFGILECDCSAYGGGTHSINVNEECMGPMGCDHCKTIEYFCWPYP